jgi:hypothetical protein
MFINGKTYNEGYTVKYMQGAEKRKLARELVMSSVSYFAGTPPPK